MSNFAPKVAIIGAGPAGFYLASALAAKYKEMQIDLFDQLPAPYGLVRYGVAPDHEKIKSVTNLYARTALLPNIRFFGLVQFGKDLSLQDLISHYHQIAFTVGAQLDRKLHIPGEELHGSLSATEFVAWYNGHPSYADLNPDLSCETVAVIGVGNVAIDVARILAKTVDELHTTDIADYALAQLATSKVRNIHILARRGPTQAKFTPAELSELTELQVADVIVDQADLDADITDITGHDRAVRRNLELFHTIARQEKPSKARAIHFKFFTSPVEIIGENGRVAALRTERNELFQGKDGQLRARGTGQYEILPVGMVMRSIGYQSVPLPDLPFDEQNALFPNQQGRLWDLVADKAIPHLYVAGWAKRGPTGVIGTNKPDAIETAECMLADLATSLADGGAKADDICQLLNEREIRYLTFADWQKLDRLEVQNGQAQGRPRVKMANIDTILAALSNA